MNRIYRLVFNPALGQLQVASEIAAAPHGGRTAATASRRTRARLACAILLGLACACGSGWAQTLPPDRLPTAAIVTHGIADITWGAPGSNLLTITQNGRTVIDWARFDIGAQAQVDFVQSPGSIALNRVTGGAYSRIDGRLTADAGVFLINPLGVVFGGGSSVNVGSLLVSTLAMDAPSIDRFAAGHDSFDFSQTSLQTVVRNDGTLEASSGAVSLVGGSVSNWGAIRGREVNLVGARQAAMTLEDDGHGLAITAGTEGASSVAASIHNAGTLHSTGGNVRLSARGAVGWPVTIINTTGVIEAQSLSGQGGRVTLDAVDGNVALDGRVVAAAGIDVRSTHDVVLGGAVQISDARGDLVIEAGAAITQTAALTVTGTSRLSAGGAIALNHAGNDFGGAVTASGASIALRDINNLTLGELTATGGGALNLSAGGTLTTGGVVQGGNVRMHGGSSVIVDHLVTGTSGIRLSSGGAIVQGVSGRVVAPILAVDAASASLAASGNVVGALNNVRIDAGFQFRNSTAITQTAGATVEVTGDTTLDAGSHAVVLDNAGNDFGGAVSASGNGIALRDANDLRIGTLSNATNGDLSLRAGADLLLPAGAIDTGSGTLTLHAGGSLQTSGALRGGMVALRSGGNIDLSHDINAGAGLTLAADGSIRQQAGSLTAPRLDVTSGSFADLGMTANRVDALGDVVASGAFTFDNAQAVTQLTDTTLAIGGVADITAVGGAIVLDNALNTFGEALFLQGEGVSVRAAGDLRLGALTSGLDRGVRLVAGGRLMLDTPVAIDTGTGALTLASNGGALAVNRDLSGGDIHLTGRDGITLARDISAGGTLALHTDHDAIVQTGGSIAVAGATTANTSGGMDPNGPATPDYGTFGDVRLGGAGNLFNGPVTLFGRDLMIGNAGRLRLDTVRGNALTADGGTIELGRSITTTGSQTYGGAVELAASLGLTSTGGDIAFGQTVDGAHALAIDAGGAWRTGGPVGGTSALSALRVRTGSDLDLAHRIFATGDILLSSRGRFINGIGAGALSSSAGRWLVHLDAIDGDHQFNGLDSGNTALLGIASPTAATAGGNRYAFAEAGTLTFTTLDRSKTYGETVDLSSAWRVDGLLQDRAGAYRGHSLTEVLNGAVQVVSDGAVAGAPVAAAPYAIEIDAAGLTADGYALVFDNSGRLDIGRAALTIAANDGSKSYGSEGGLAGFRVDGLRAGDAVTGANLASAGTSATANAGRYAITIDGATGHGLSNYDITYVDGILTIGRLGLVIRAHDLDKTYGEDVSLSGYSIEGLINDHRVDGVTLASAGSPGSAKVGQYTISVGDATGEGLENYDITYVDGTLTIGRAGLVITAHDAGKTYGQTAALEGYSVEGLRNDDAVAGVALGSAGTARTAHVGQYAISVGDATGEGLENYDITYVGGTLTIGRAGLVITAHDAGKTYGRTAALDGYSVEGLRNDDTVAGVALGSAGTARTAHVGRYTITAADADGTGLSNYDITYVDGTLTVGKAGLTIVAGDAGKRFGDPVALRDYSVDGLLNDDTVDGVALSSAGAPTGALPGRYAVTAGDARGTGLSNYDITYVDGMLEVEFHDDDRQIARAVRSHSPPHASTAEMRPAPESALYQRIGEGIHLPPDCSERDGRAHGCPMGR